MYPKTIAAVRLIALGILVLAYAGIAYVINGKSGTAFGAFYGN